jgi:hypothetical protein
MRDRGESPGAAGAALRDILSLILPHMRAAKNAARMN